MKKGFTLIELLAVVVIIGLIIVFVVPSIMNSVKNSDDLEYKNFLETLSMAGETYYQSNKDICDFSNSNVCYLEVGNLISSGLIEQDLINPKTEKQVLSNDTITILKDEYGTLTYSYSSNENYIKDNLILHYDAINNTGNGHSNNTTTWKDLSGNNNDGTINGATWNGNALSFDGINDFVLINEMNKKDMTIEVVTKSYTGAGSTEYDVISNVHGGGYQIKFNLQYSNLSSCTFVSKYECQVFGHYKFNKVNYMSLRFDNSKQIFNYNNKSIQINLSGEVNPPGGNTYLVLGCNPGGNKCDGNYYKGEIYSVRIYDRVLSDEELKQNYEIDANRYGIAQNTTDDYVQNNLVLHYDAINNTGSGHSNDTTTWEDLSGNNNDGTIYSQKWENNSLIFDGTNTYVSTPITSINESVTFEVVAKIPEVVSVDEQYLIAFSPEVYNYTGISFMNTGMMRPLSYYQSEMHNYIDYTKYIGKTITFTLVARKNGASAFYINGKKVLDYTSGDVSPGTINLTIGDLRANRGLKFKGNIYNVRIYNGTLTEQEITDNFNLDKIRYNIKEA